MKRFRISRDYPHRVFVDGNYIGDIVRSETKKGVWISCVNGRKIESDNFSDARCYAAHLS